MRGNEWEQFEGHGQSKTKQNEEAKTEIYRRP